jgi:hypothetical protein
MSKIISIIVSVILIVHGVYSIKSGYKKSGKIAGLVFSDDRYLLDKFLGEKKANDYLNLFWGILEFILGLLIAYYEIFKR